MADPLSEIVYPLLREVGHFGWGHLKARIGHPPGSEEHLREQQAKLLLPSDLRGQVVLPSQMLRRESTGSANVLLPSQVAGRVQEAGPTLAREASARESYAAEVDVAVACVPCTRRHLATMVEAAEQALREHGMERRRNLALVAAEGAVWDRYDVTPDKLALSSPRDRDAILAVRPRVLQALSEVPQAPRQLVLAYGATQEALRFASSPRPTERDRQEVALRMRDVEGWIGYLEASNPPGYERHRDAIREARHRLAREGYTAETLAFARDRLEAATIDLTPEADDATCRGLHRELREARDELYARVLGLPSREQRARDRAYPRGWHLDEDTRLPRELREEFILDVGPEPPYGGLLGATPETASAFRNLLAFGDRIGVIERERQLPATWEAIVKGAYSPQLDVLWLSPAALAEDRDGLETLTHELSHALLHNPRCLPAPTPDYTERYAETVEEREADLTTALTFRKLGLQMEDDIGNLFTPEVDLKKLRQQDPVTARRVEWASDVLARAAAGDLRNAASQANSCPVRSG